MPDKFDIFGHLVKKMSLTFLKDGLANKINERNVQGGSDSCFILQHNYKVTLRRFHTIFFITLSIFVDSVALPKQGDNVLGSVRPSVCPSVCALMPEPFDLDIISPRCLSVFRIIAPVRSIGFYFMEKRINYICVIYLC